MASFTHNQHNEEWSRSDKYHNSFLIPKDDVLDKVLANSVERGLPDIAVSPAQGKYLQLLAQSVGAKRILEVGTLGGFSTIWMGRALPQDGELISLEVDEKHVRISRENIETAGLSSKIKVIHGPAAETIMKLEANPPFDLAFIDADKVNNVKYFTEAKRLVRKGGIIVVDNVVRFGKVSDPDHTEPDTEGVRALLKSIQGDSEVDATTIATVGERGLDGFLFALRK